MGCGVSDLSLSEITCIVHGFIFAYEQQATQNVNNDALFFQKLPYVLNRKFAWNLASCLHTRSSVCAFQGRAVEGQGSISVPFSLVQISYISPERVPV